MQQCTQCGRQADRFRQIFTLRTGLAPVSERVCLACWQAWIDSMHPQAAQERPVAIETDAGLDLPLFKYGAGL